MKKIWKVVGAAALLAGLTPFQRSVDPVTGEVRMDALLWSSSLRTKPNGARRLSLYPGWSAVPLISRDLPPRPKKEQPEEELDLVFTWRASQEEAAADPQPDLETAQMPQQDPSPEPDCQEGQMPQQAPQESGSIDYEE